MAGWATVYCVSIHIQEDLVIVSSWELLPLCPRRVHLRCHCLHPGRGISASFCGGLGLVSNGAARHGEAASCIPPSSGGECRSGVSVLVCAQVEEPAVFIGVSKGAGDAEPLTYPPVECLHVLDPFSG